MEIACWELSAHFPTAPACFHGLTSRKMQLSCRSLHKATLVMQLGVQAASGWMVGPRTDLVQPIHSLPRSTFPAPPLTPPPPSADSPIETVPPWPRLSQ
jgi:hypothetical protein